MPGRVFLLDGGTGSELRRRGVPLSATAWSGLAALYHGAVLRDIHLDFLRAGADGIIANTFGGARYLLDAAGAGTAFERINRRAVALAREARAAAGAAAADTLLLGSLSNLPPMDGSGYPPPAREAADLRELALLLADAGVDALALEMIQDPRHGERALAAALETGLPVWLGVSARLEPTGVGCFDDPAAPLAAVLDALLPMRPDAVAIMHTPLDAVLPALTLLRERWNGTFGVYPELPYESGARTPSPDELRRCAQRWIASGATLIGGSCGTTPVHIRALAELRDAQP